MDPFHSMPATSRVVNAVEVLNGVSSISSEQHIELRESQQSSDIANMKISPLLGSLSSGVVAIEDINCYNALSIRKASMKAMEGKVFSDVYLQRKNSVLSLESVTKTTRMRDEDVCVNPHRVVCIVRSEKKLGCYLIYKLAAWPPALFDDCSFRKGNE
ncbi:hypothetical protein PR048_002102 [Dryococelus australis]|uniref:Uncharacterized protein n=1 Tax=Dryococelus australis TaxID=614101 RepID=A0ABQ9IJC7_9NEOP|nr:hypothetical protein PR048_002102 [Dryococelus australis]